MNDFVDHFIGDHFPKSLKNTQQAMCP